MIGVTGTSGKTTTSYLCEAGLRAAGHSDRPDRRGGDQDRCRAGQGVADHTGGAGPAGAARRDGRARGDGRRDGGLQPLAGARPGRGHPLRRRGLHQPVPGPPGLSRGLRGLLPGQGEAVHPGVLRRGRGQRGRPATAGAWWPRRRCRSSRSARTRPPARTRSGVAGGRRRCGADGSTFRVIGPGGVEADASVTLPGPFNVANALAAIVALVEAGTDLADAVEGVASCPGVPGRLERVAAGQPPDAFVDYSHKPGAVEAVLARAAPGDQRRTDRGARLRRRPRPRQAPADGRRRRRLADVAILTSDNPRSEDPLAILAEMLQGVLGVPQVERARVIIEPDRAAAIELAVGMAREGGRGAGGGQGARDRAVRRGSRAAVRRRGGHGRGALARCAADRRPS